MRTRKNKCLYRRKPQARNDASSDTPFLPWRTTASRSIFRLTLIACLFLVIGVSTPGIALSVQRESHSVTTFSVSGFSAEVACSRGKRKSSKGIFFKGKFSKRSVLQKRLRKKIQSTQGGRKAALLKRIRSADNALSLYASKRGKSALRRLDCRITGGSSASSSKTPSPQSGKLPPALPTAALAQWEQNMRTFGEQHCATISDSTQSFDTRLLATYYDAQWVYQQIALHTGDSSWLECAQAAEQVYRDLYVNPSNGAVPGFWNFSHGLLYDFVTTGDSQSQQALIALSQRAMFANDQTPLDSSAHADFSREVAYAIHSYLNAELAGEPRRARLSLLVDQALGQIDQWIYSGSAPYVRPFMVSLTAHALISYHEQVNDSRVLPAVRDALDWLWENTWEPGEQAFRYTDREHPTGGTEPAPDLNLLIAPAFAWVYHQTGEDSYRVKADRIFEGGVQAAFLYNGKQFNQNYRWSFAYYKWRTARTLQ